MINLEKSREAVADLIAECDQRVSARREIAGEFCGPNAPALFIMLGKTCEARYVKQVKETVELGWNSLHQYIRYLEFPGSVSCEELADQAEQAIVKMKKAPKGVFKSFAESRVYVFLDLNEEQAEEYMDLFSEEKNLAKELGFGAQVVLFAMVDQTERKTKELINARIRKIMDCKKARKLAGAMILSNVLKSERILADEELCENYRLAADVSYVSNSYDLMTGKVFDVSNSMTSDLMREDCTCTAAYIKLSKPSEAIAKTILRTMVNQHIEQEKSIVENVDFDRSKYAFFNRLTETNKENGPFGLDTIFRQQIRQKLPPHHFLQYLPYSEALDKKKGGCTNVQEVFGLMCPQARDTWMMVEKRYFKNSVKAYVDANKEQLCNMAEEELRKIFPYTEFLAFCENTSQREEIQRDIRSGSLFKDVPMTAGTDVVSMLLWEQGARTARKHFYELAGPVCEEAFNRYLEHAKKFKEIVETESTLLNMGMIEPNIYEFYRDYIKHQMNYSECRKDFLKVFDTPAQWCEHLKELFLNLVEKHADKLDTTFEQELNLRIVNGTTTTIMDELGFKNQRLDAECRLEYGNSPSGNSYCLSYAGAKFVTEIEKHRDEMGDLFASSRQDSVERLMICPFECDISYFNGKEETAG